MIEIVVESDGISSFLSATVERMGDATVPLTAILTDGLASAALQVLEGKGSAFGGFPWAPMSPATVKKGRDPATLLVDSGRLAMSLTQGGSGNFFQVGPTEGFAGTGVASERNGYGYAVGQQYGSATRPARPFLVWYESRMSIYDQIMMDWIAGESAVQQ